MREAVTVAAVPFARSNARIISRHLVEYAWWCIQVLTESAIRQILHRKPLFPLRSVVKYSVVGLSGCKFCAELNSLQLRSIGLEYAYWGVHMWRYSYASSFAVLIRWLPSWNTCFDWEDVYWLRILRSVKDDDLLGWRLGRSEYDMPVMWRLCW